MAASQGPPTSPDLCSAPGRILVQAPHYCPSHGWTARVQLPQELPPEVMAHCPHHGWTTHAWRDDDSSSEEHVSPRRSPSPDYTPETPPASPLMAPATAPVEAPPEFLLRGTIAARRGAPPSYMSAGGSSSVAVVAAPPGFEAPPPAPHAAVAAPPGFEEPSLAPPPPPPAPWFPGRPTAAAAANTRPGLRRFIKTGHIPTEMSGSLEARRCPPSGEGEA
nr:unnamed protein product [Digitaria exilis]